jgi:hypothetical protein
MKKPKFTEQKTVFAQKQTENEVNVNEICRKMG